MNSSTSDEKQAELAAVVTRLKQLRQEQQSQAAQLAEQRLQDAYARRSQLEAALKQSAASADEKARLDHWRVLMDECRDPERWPAMQPRIDAARQEYDAAAKQRRAEQKAFQADPIHAEINELERAKQDRRQQIDDDTRRVGELQSAIRRQRLGDFTAADAAVSVAQGQLAQGPPDPHDEPQIKGLHRQWCDLIRAFNERESWRPPQTGPTLTAADASRIDATRRQYEARDRGMVDRIHAAEAEYTAAVVAQWRQRQAIRNRIEAEAEARLPVLVAARDAAERAIHEPIGA